LAQFPPRFRGVTASTEEIIIARGDLPVARLVPNVGETPRRKPGALRGAVKIAGAFFEPLPEEELEAWGSKAQ